MKSTTLKRKLKIDKIRSVLLDGYHFCLGGNWKRRMFWVEPPMDGYTLRIRFEEET